jgi:hypothetical protein
VVFLIEQENTSLWGEQLNEDCFGDTTGFVFLSVCQMTLNFWCEFFFWWGGAVTKSFVVELCALESHVVWREHINEKQDLKNLCGEICKFFYLRIQYFLDYTLLKISMEDKHIIKFDSRQQ